jgi:hypothetical protein
VPSSAARILASRSREESSFKVMFVFIAQIYVRHDYTCSTSIEANDPRRTRSRVCPPGKLRSATKPNCHDLAKPLPSQVLKRRC